jgi:Spx/MgsR family transcriptional regulator
MITIYGIKNCDTMKKAFDWFQASDIDYAFHDYKKQGAPRDKLLAWCKSQGWETLINTKGPTWRKLAPEQQAITTPNGAVTLLLEYSSAIRRPIVEKEDGSILIGFDPEQLEAFVRSHQGIPSRLRRDISRQGIPSRLRRDIC